MLGQVGKPICSTSLAWQCVKQGLQGDLGLCCPPQACKLEAGSSC